MKNFVVLVAIWVQPAKPIRSPLFTTRREALLTSSVLWPALPPQPAFADESISAKLSKRSSTVLKKPLFNLAPGQQAFPAWFGGDWETAITFKGFEFPTIVAALKHRGSFWSFWCFCISWISALFE